MAKGVQKRRRAKAWTKTVTRIRDYFSGGGCACNRVRSFNTRNVRLLSERTRLDPSAVAHDARFYSTSFTPFALPWPAWAGVRAAAAASEWGATPLRRTP